MNKYPLLIFLLDWDVLSDMFGLPDCLHLLGTLDSSLHSSASKTSLHSVSVGLHHMIILLIIFFLQLYTFLFRTRLAVIITSLVALGN